METIPANSPTSQWFEKLLVHGYRLTESRQAVVEVIANSDRVLTATEVFDQARERCASLGLVTVYRTIAKLEELALVDRVHQPGDCHTYVAAVPGHQHLLICQDCGRATYFEGDSLEALMRRVAADSGYQVRDHWLQLFGLCAACQSRAGES